MNNVLQIKVKNFMKFYISQAKKIWVKSSLHLKNMGQ